MPQRKGLGQYSLVLENGGGVSDSGVSQQLNAIVAANRFCRYLSKDINKVLQELTPAE